jgi:hypothetical protein
MASSSPGVFAFNPWSLISLSSDISVMDLTGKPLREARPQ